MLTGLERKEAFEQGIREAGKEYSPEAKAFEITSAGRFLGDGEETPSQYLMKADGAAINPDCHCMILYSDNMEMGECLGIAHASTRAPSSHSS